MSISSLTLSLGIIGVDKTSAMFKGITNNLSQVETKVNSVRSVFGSLGSAIERVDGHMSSLAMTGAKVAVALQPVILATQQAIALNKSMTSMGVSLANSGESPGAVRARMMARLPGMHALGKGTAYSDRQIADMETTLLKAGVSDRDVSGGKGATYALSRLGTISGADTGFLAESMAGVASQYNLKGNQFGEFANSLAKYESAAAGRASVESLLQAFTMTGASASMLGVSADETAKSLAVLAPLGDRSGSSLNMFLTMLSKNTTAKDASGREWSASQFRVTDKDGNLDIEKTVSKMKQIFGTMNKTSRNSIFSTLFGEEGSRAAGTFVTAVSDFKTIGDAAKNAATLEEKVTLANESTASALDRLKASIENTSASITTQFLPMVSGVAELGVGIADYAQKHKAVATAGLLATILPATLFAFSPLAKGIDTIFGKAGAGKLSGHVAGMAAKAMGETPVFVTNWPSGGFGGGGGTSPTGRKFGDIDLNAPDGNPLKSPTLLTSMRGGLNSWAGAIPGIGGALSASVGTAGIGAVAGGAVVAAGVGVGIGLLINKITDNVKDSAGVSLSDKMSDALVPLVLAIDDIPMIFSHFGDSEEKKKKADADKYLAEQQKLLGGGHGSRSSIHNHIHMDGKEIAKHVHIIKNTTQTQTVSDLTK